MKSPVKYLACLAAALLLSVVFAQPSNFRIVRAGPPTPATVAARNLPIVGPITTTSNGQRIENLRIQRTSGTGPCITVNHTGVVIQDNEIGPCGATESTDNNGIVSTGATNITIRRNVIHNVSNGVYLTSAQHPFVFEQNYVYNLRGPFPRGQAFQTNGITGGTGSSKIKCNISDTMPGVRYGVDHNITNVEDHINLFNTLGVDSTTNRIEIAYNRLRGGHPTSTSGSGINVGDGASGGNTYSHDNIVVSTRNAAIAITNGTNVTHDNNRIYMDTTPWSGVDWGGTGCSIASGFGTGSAATCHTNTISNTRVRAIGQTAQCNGYCVITFTNNNFNDTSLTEAIFDEAWPAACTY